MVRGHALPSRFLFLWVLLPGAMMSPGLAGTQEPLPVANIKAKFESGRLLGRGALQSCSGRPSHKEGMQELRFGPLFVLVMDMGTYLRFVPFCSTEHLFFAC